MSDPSARPGPSVSQMNDPIMNDSKQKSLSSVSTVSKAHHLLGSMLRGLPNIRGKGRMATFLNGFFLKKGSKSLVEVTMKNGTRVIVDLHSKTELPAFFSGHYDPEIIRACMAIYDPEKVFLDVGANIGFWSVSIGRYIQHSGSSGRLLAFEPHPGNFGRLNENIELNHLSGVLQTFPFGLSDESRCLNLVLREDFVGGSGTGNASIATSKDFDHGFESISINVEILDEVYCEIAAGLPCETIDFIKVDIEGHEDYFLRGGHSTLCRFRPVIVTEINKGFLDARGLEADVAILDSLPSNYGAWQLNGSAMTSLPSLNKISGLANVFLIPNERLNQCKLDCKQLSWNEHY